MPFDSIPVYFPWVLRTLFFSAPLICLILLPGEFGAGDGQPWGLIAVFFVMIICMWPFVVASHSLRIREDSLILRYFPILTKRVDIASVLTVDELDRVTPSQVGGMGLRMARGGVLAFANRSGPALAIELVDGRKFCIVLKSDDERSEAIAALAKGGGR